MARDMHKEREWVASLHDPHRSGEWGGRGPFAGWYGSFPPASEREARMDDPMIRSRQGRINRDATLGALDPKLRVPFDSGTAARFVKHFRPRLSSGND